MLPVDQVVSIVSPIASPVKPAQTGKPVLPVFKWVGGKHFLSSKLVNVLPDRMNAYYEPFAGSLGMFLRTRPNCPVYIADINVHLINAYVQIRDNPAQLHKALMRHVEAADGNFRTYYKEVRRKFPRERDPLERGALFSYLNRSCFKGVWRENRKGEMNVGPATFPPVYPELDRFLQVSDALQGASLHALSYRNTPIVAGAFYFLDPPYYSTYTGYDRRGFNEDEQREVAELCHKISKAGGRFMLCNVGVPFTYELYRPYRKLVLSDRCGRSFRGREPEVVFKNY